MTRLNKNEISRHKERLTAWQTPTNMKGYIEHVNDHMGSKDFFNQAGIEFLRDAWIAAEFSLVRNAKLVRLISDNWPDFEIQVNGEIERFEAIEADEHGRRRGDEYREKEARRGPDGFLLEDDPVEDWIKRAEQVPKILLAAIQKKAEKKYGGTAQLVIYLNINEFGIRQREIEMCFPSACKLGCDKFDAIWILWKNKIYGPFAKSLRSAI